MTRRLLLPALLAALLAGGLAAAATGPAALAEKQAAEAAARAERLRAQAARATDEAARVRAEAEATVADIQKIEAEITAADAHLARIGALQAELRARLAERQQPLVGLTAALQTMARRPAALALAQPGSLDEMVRVRALLASTLPAVRERTADLRQEAEEGERLRAQAAAAVARLAASRAALQERRIALVRLEEKERGRSEAFVRQAFSESDRALALTEEARRIEAEANQSRSRVETLEALAALPAPRLRPGEGQERPRGQAPYRLPVEGRLLRGMGEISEAGVHARGVTFETRADAPVVAPRSGTIVYAGRFRSYGEVVIVDHGGGWTTTLTNLRALRVRQGDKVAAGDPIGRAGDTVTVELRQGDRPVPIARFIA